MKKRLFAFLLGTVFTALALTGCESNLQKAAESSKAAANIADMDYTQLYSEGEGYHFPDLKWGTTLEELKSTYENAITSYSSFTADGDSVYTADLLGRKVVGRVPESTDLAFDENQELYMVTLGFNGDGIKTGEASQSDVVSAIREQVTALYGAETEESKSDTYISDSKAVVTTWKWTEMLPNGTKTELQLAQAVIGYATEPSYVSFGVVYTTKERQEKIDSETTEADSDGISTEADSDGAGVEAEDTKDSTQVK